MAVKLNLSFDERIAETARRVAAEDGKSISGYLSGLVEADARRRQDELAEEGYRLLGADSLAFAEAALPLAAEVWPDGDSSSVA